MSKIRDIDWDGIAQRHPVVAKICRSWWNVPLVDYSEALWSPLARPPMSSGLRIAVASVLKRQAPSQADVGLSALDALRVLPTAHHVTPTNGPGFLAADVIASAGLPAEVPLLVAAWSGVAMSNTAWSGCLSMGRTELASLVRPDSPSWSRQRGAWQRRCADGASDRRLSLVPARMRDALVYGHAIPQTLRETLSDLQPAVLELMEKPGTLLPRWALSTCAKIQSRVLHRPVIYIDLNEVIVAYLCEALADGSHPLSALIADGGVHDELEASLGHMPFAYSTRMSRNKEKVDHLYLREGHLVGREHRLPMSVLPSALASGTVCPGLPLAFGVLGAADGVRCLGSFQQVSYHAEIARVWTALGLGKPGPLDEAPTLIAGRIPEERYPLDLALAGTSVWRVVSPSEPMSTLWRPLMNRLQPSEASSGE